MKKDIVKVLISAFVLVAALLTRNANSTISLILFIISFAISGFDVVCSAVKGILRGNIFNENTLMTIASIGAFIIGEYPEAVFVIVFYRAGELFENYAVNKSRKSIKEVLDICPDYANVLQDGKTVKISPEEVHTGDKIIIAAGEKIPLDCIVTDGTSFVDTSALTGESVPKRKTVGDEILSGCINGNGVLTAEVTKLFCESAVYKITELIETSSARKSKCEKFITRFSKYYTPCVLIAALLLAVLPPLFIEGAQFKDYIYRALSFLVVSCPCALVISVPLSFFGGIGGAAKNGILIKGGNYLEALSKADTVVFDKTGTLTAGTFEVTDIEAVNCSKDELTMMTAYAESVSSHPIADAVRKSYGQNIDTSIISEAVEIAGCGVSAKIGSKHVLAGNIALMKKNGISVTEKNAGTVVYVACDGKFSGSVTVSDKIKPDAKNLISELKKSSVKRTVMLTGDAKKNADETAAIIGTDEVYSELLPEDKVNIFEKISGESNGTTVYAGDGINDAPVLAVSDVGIAMGALGSDCAIEAADIVIMTDEISKISSALKTAKKTMAIAKQNIVFSIAVKLLILILCSFNIVGIGTAVFGDVGVMVMAVLNSFRTLFQSDKNN